MKKENKLSLVITLGVGVVTAIGITTNDLGLWIALGVAVSVGVGTNLIQKNSKKTNDDGSKKSV